MKSIRRVARDRPLLHHRDAAPQRTVFTPRTGLVCAAYLGATVASVHWRRRARVRRWWLTAIGQIRLGLADTELAFAARIAASRILDANGANLRVIDVIERTTRAG